MYKLYYIYTHHEDVILPQATWAVAAPLAAWRGDEAAALCRGQWGATSSAVGRVYAESWVMELVPSGKHTKNYGKSHFLMGKLTISMAMFNSYVKLPEGN